MNLYDSTKIIEVPKLMSQIKTQKMKKISGKTEMSTKWTEYKKK